MKILHVSRSCSVAIVVLAVGVAWSVGTPSRMSSDRLSIVGGLCDCEYSSTVAQSKKCTTLISGCSGSISSIVGGDTSGTKDEYVVDGANCPETAGVSGCETQSGTLNDNNCRLMY